jgi:hypothetical protein
VERVGVCILGVCYYTVRNTCGRGDCVFISSSIWVIQGTSSLMILLQPNKKRREPGYFHPRTMMHCPVDKGFKMISRHLPLMDMIHTKRYVKWTRENC